MKWFEILLKLLGTASSLAPIVVRALGVLPIRPALSGWLPWVAVAVAIPAALLGVLSRPLITKAQKALLVSLVAYVSLIVLFPTPLPVGDRVLLLALVLTYLTVFASFSFTVSYLLTALARRWSASSD
jgi:hypothetical protein